MEQTVVAHLQGTAEDIAALRAAVASGEVENFEISDAEDPSISLNLPLGITPMEYLAVVFIGHLAAGLTHDAIKGVIAAKINRKESGESGIEVRKVETQDGLKEEKDSEE